MSEKYIWYASNKQNFLTAHNQFLARFDVTQIHSKKREPKHERIRQMYVAMKVYNKDRAQQSRNQHTVTKYMEWQSGLPKKITEQNENAAT